MDALTRIKAMNGAMRRRDSALNAELTRRADAETRGLEAVRDEFQVESIILRTGRPVLAVVRDEAQLIFQDPDSAVWRARLSAARAALTRAARSVGRIEVVGHRLEWLGTGWLVAPDTIVTNRHVAAEFARRSGTTFTFRAGLDGKDMRASIDFLEEIDREESLQYALSQVLHIEDTDGPDLAFLRVDQIGGESPPTPIRLAETSDADELVAVIGYPARDSRIPDVDLMDRIFGDVYDKKRLAPGQLLERRSESLLHDCTTLGGSSGSVVLSLETGDAVGLHFAGRFLQSNFAVPSRVVAQRLDQLRGGLLSGLQGGGEALPPVAGTASASAPAETSVTYTVPVTITVHVGEPSRPGAGAPTAGAPAVSGATGDVFVETLPEDYLDREGYDDLFLGEAAAVSLPPVTRGVEDVLTFDLGGPQQVLKYEHFSVVMSRSRKLCLFSAVNIDGNQEVEGLQRPGWRIDPRIPADAQIRDTCYGNPPKFSRGHMTRREYPNWGSDATAQKANADSMHVTNAVPQMQPFNGGIWLQLEDYALQNARRDDMKISVFTGPFLEDADPTMFDVKIPVEFWKVIAFIHDETGELCATGYTMSQREFLQEDEFVFGQHETAQRSISSIEARTGLSFGRLTELDPFEEPEGIAPAPLADVGQIRFVQRR